ncbi:RNA exonuclease 1 homolog [Pelobates cultripes]|uniref:RNA exonuclease 1 homolog n=1 Tax=Pelobates cultripes TaxID=61616 RepID=A0AAD1SBE8_PELCU|nr:RNA exonuclease 1 homolog [Pelobates cultripes]
MLSSAGYFQLVQCPFWQEPGGCQRPYCHFRHVPPAGAGDRPCAPSQAASCPPKEVLGKTIQELERLNKAIEAVKNEVEEKQKKLLQYKNVTQPQTQLPIVKMDSNSNISAGLDDQAAVLKRSALTTDTIGSFKSGCVPHEKYVVDRRCPATDLEYDPLLNYSAGIFGSAAKENGKFKSKRLKCDEDFDNTPPKKSRAASPIRLEIKLQESDEDDVLVIDAPPLPAVAKKQRAKKFCPNETKSVHIVEITEAVDIADTLNNAVGKIECVSNLENKVEVCEKSELESNSEAKSPKESLTATADFDENQTLNCKSETFITTELVTNIKSSLSPEQHEGQSEKHYCPLNYDQNVVNYDHIPFSDPDVIPKYDIDLKDLLVPEKMLNESSTYVSGEEILEGNNCAITSQTFALNKCETTTELMTPSTKCESSGQTASLEKVNNVIVLNSSEEDASEDDSDFSDSDDPMEECLRIFNEFAETNKEANQATVKTNWDQSKLDMPETKGSDVLPGQKKRIAHPSAKCEVKSRMDSLRCQIYVNLVELQPVVPCRNSLGGFFQGGALATTFRSNVPQKRTLQTTPMKIPTRRKPSVVQETSSKVPHETRQRYVNSFVEEFLKESATVQEAFDKALNEEKSIYERCGSKNMYLNIAVNSLKKLRDQRNFPNGSHQSGSRENAPGSKKQGDRPELTGVNLYNLLKEYLLSDEQLQENGFPLLNLDKPGSAILPNGGTKPIGSDALRRVCCRCGKIYSVTLQGKHTRKEECNYHSGKVLRHRVPGGIETRYSCCDAVVGTPGCQMAKVHVHDGQKENLDGFIKTFVKLQPSDGNPGVYALDCEMCYTTHGLELTRVTVVDPSLQVVYDTFVKPDNEILDYNTRFSGVTEENLENVTTSIRDVQAIMLNLFSADTILIGHSLENDLIALKLIHDTVVDTSIVFPHRLGLPHKKALRNLMADFLRRIIQDNVGGHDSSEDATACMELMLWKVKEDTKGRR